jgi:amino acid transporter
MGVDPEIAPTTSASKTAEVSSQHDGDLKEGLVENNGHFTAAELAKYGQTQRGLSPRHVQLMAIGGKTPHPAQGSVQVLTK